MFQSGDTVVRITTPLEGGIPKGTKVIVKAIIDDKYMTLEGIQGNYLMSHFRTHEESNREGPRSDLESLVDALTVIDNWNRTHPTAMMVGVEPYPTQDGGMVVSVNGEGFNNVDDFYRYVAYYATKQDRKESIKKAMVLLEAELEE